MGLWPTAESGQGLQAPGRLCKVSFGPAANERVSPEPVVLEARAPQETQRGFYYFWAQVWAHDD